MADPVNGLTVDHLSVWLPSRGIVLDDVTLTALAGRITAVVGRSGAGATTLLRAVAGRLRPGAMTRGVAAVRGVPVDDVAPTDLCLVDPDLVPVSEGPRSHPDVRAGLAVDHLRDRPVILLDHPCAGLEDEARAELASRLRRMADRGAVVLWADHDLDTLWSVADDLVEMSAGRVLWSGPVMDWAPRTMPEPVLATTARLLGLDRSACRTVPDLADQRRRCAVRIPAGPLAHLRRGSGAPLATVRPEDVDLTVDEDPGRLVTVHHGECLGVWTVPQSGRTVRPEPIARALVAALPVRTYVSSTSILVPDLLDPITPALALDRWCRRTGVASEEVLPGGFRPGGRWMPEVPLAHHGRGERAALRRLLVRPVQAPVMMALADHDLDPEDRDRLAEDLRAGHGGPRIVTSRDIDFLVRACHRILVIAGRTLIADAAPERIPAVLRSVGAGLPTLPAALGTNEILRLGDLLPLAGRTPWATPTEGVVS